MLAVMTALGSGDPGMGFFRANADGEGEALLMRAMFSAGKRNG